MPHTNTRTCGQCVLRNTQSGHCPVFNQTVEADELGCRMYTTDIINCELCHNLIIGKGNALRDVTNPTPHIICRNCKQHYGHCPTCKSGNICTFETDPSSLPKVVQQEIRQGNMISVTQVKNPSRIEITCKKGCLCFHPEFGCMKQNNTCGNYIHIFSEDKKEG